MPLTSKQKRHQKDIVRAAAVDKFRETHHPRKFYHSLKCSKCTNFHRPSFNVRIMYRMDGVAMMHDNGDIERLQFRDEQDCLQILHARLISGLMGAVVVWPFHEIYLKKMAKIQTFAEAEVHDSDGCSIFWVHTKDSVSAAIHQDSPLQNLVAYCSSFESDRDC